MYLVTIKGLFQYGVIGCIEDHPHVGVCCCHSKVWVHIVRELPLKPQPWSGPVMVQLVGEDKEGVSFQLQLQDKLTPS